MPAMADRLATTILTQMGAPGASSVTASRPRAALSPVPAVSGPTKRLRTRLWITTPATASAAPGSRNRAAVSAFAMAAIFSVATVWVPWFSFLTGYNWIIGALLGGTIYNALAGKRAGR